MQKLLIVIVGACFISGCVPTVSTSAQSGNVHFSIDGDQLWRSVDGAAPELVKEARAVSADGASIYIATGGSVEVSVDGGVTWDVIFGASDAVTDVEAVNGRVYVSVNSWGARSGISRRNSDGTWEHLFWNSCQAVDVNPNRSTGGIRALVKEGGYNRYWVYAPLLGDVLWLKLYPALPPR